MLALAAMALAVSVGARPRAAQPSIHQVIWDFDDLERIGGLPVTVGGHPKLIASPVGKAIEFDGIQDSR